MYLFNAKGAGFCDSFCVSTDCLQSSDTNIDDAGAASLSGALERNTALHTLYLSGECAANRGVFDCVACVFLHGL